MLYYLFTYNLPATEMLMLVLAYLIAIVFALMCHELAHGFVAYKCGDKTAKLEGRLSLNPGETFGPLGKPFVFIRWLWLGKTRSN